MLLLLFSGSPAPVMAGPYVLSVYDPAARLLLDAVSRTLVAVDAAPTTGTIDPVPTAVAVSAVNLKGGVDA